MKRIITTLFLVLTIHSVSYAKSSDDDAKTTKQDSIDAIDVFLDIPLRVTGLLQTLLGTTIFVGTAPITAVLSAFPPYNSLDRTAEYLIFRPARYTFARNIGEVNFEPLPPKKPKPLAKLD